MVSSDSPENLLRDLEAMSRQCAIKVKLLTLTSLSYFGAAVLLLCMFGQRVSEYTHQSFGAAGEILVLLGVAGIEILREILWWKCGIARVELESLTTRKEHLLEAVANRRLLESIIKRKQPFALLLRGFKPESRFMLGDWLGDTAVPTANDSLSELHEVLLAPLTEHMPVFALFNPRDCICSPHILRVIVDGAWRTVFCQYAGHAKLLIFVLDSLTENTAFELKWVLRNDRTRDSFLVAPGDTLDAMRRTLPWTGLTFSISRIFFSPAVGLGIGYPSVDKQTLREFKSKIHERVLGHDGDVPEWHEDKR